MTKDSSIARWRSMLEAIARNGIGFTQNPFDRERFEEVLEIALEMGRGNALFSALHDDVIDLRDDDDMSVFVRYTTPKLACRWRCPTTEDACCSFAVPAPASGASPQIRRRWLLGC